MRVRLELLDYLSEAFGADSRLTYEAIRDRVGSGSRIYRVGEPDGFVVGGKGLVGVVVPAQPTNIYDAITMKLRARKVFDVDDVQVLVYSADETPEAAMQEAADDAREAGKRLIWPSPGIHLVACNQAQEFVGITFHQKGTPAPIFEELSWAKLDNHITIEVPHEIKGSLPSSVKGATK